MQFALDENKNRIKPTKELNGYCPSCGEHLVAKMGEIKIHHWSHKIEGNCNYKPMTEWHYNWQNKFPEENREIIYVDKDTEEKHIADVSIDNYVFEFQHSSISIEEFNSRANFYTNKLNKKLIWIFDYNEKASNFNLYTIPHIKFHPNRLYYSFEHKWKPKYLNDYNQYFNMLIIYETPKLLYYHITEDVIYQTNKADFSYDLFRNNMNRILHMQKQYLEDKSIKNASKIIHELQNKIDMLSDTIELENDKRIELEIKIEQLENEIYDITNEPNKYLIATISELKDKIIKLEKENKKLNFNDEAGNIVIKNLKSTLHNMSNKFIDIESKYIISERNLNLLKEENKTLKNELNKKQSLFLENIYNLQMSK